MRPIVRRPYHQALSPAHDSQAPERYQNNDAEAPAFDVPGAPLDTVAEDYRPGGCPLASSNGSPATQALGAIPRPYMGRTLSEAQSPPQHTLPRYQMPSMGTHRSSLDHRDAQPDRQSRARVPASQDVALDCGYYSAKGRSPEDIVSPARDSRAHSHFRAPCAEHTLLVYRMGSARYLERCVEEGLVMDFDSMKPDPLDSEPRALEPYHAPWRFYQSCPQVYHPSDHVPLPPLAIGEVPLLAENLRGSVTSASQHLVISGCRAYRTPVPAQDGHITSRHITQYAVPMFVLDLMEKGSTGYNTFYHRAECPCNTGFSTMALQLSASSIVATSEHTVNHLVTPEDYTAVSLGASHFAKVTIVCLPYMAPYFYVEGSLCKDGTCISKLGVPDYRPDALCGPLSAYPPMVPRLKVMCILES